MSVIPSPVLQVCQFANGWVVGSAADPSLDQHELAEVKDFDVIVPLSHWHIGKLVIPGDATVNSFRGFKFTYEGQVIDMWPSDVGEYINNSFGQYLWNPVRQIRLTVSRV